LEDFTEFTMLVSVGTKMNWLDFEVKDQMSESQPDQIWSEIHLWTHF